ncbi:MAG: thiosulfate oxidation carrier protein SoxY [Magnetococcales bacterium]|nr:thiosulfate oxidation carrier protein SoxY [Magnetococcales bacterium]
MFDQNNHPVSRRQLFAATGACTLAALLAAVRPPTATAAEIQEEIRKVMGTGEITNRRVTLDAPEIAENGAMVPIRVTVDHPMLPEHFVESVAVFVAKNPTPLAAQYRLTPGAGKAEVSLRIKMGETSMVYAIARTNRGELLEGSKEVKVTIGGCGG